MTKEVIAIVASSVGAVGILAGLHYHLYVKVRKAIADTQVLMDAYRAKADHDYVALRAGITYATSAIHSKVDSVTGAVEEKIADGLLSVLSPLELHTQNLKTHAEDLRNHAKSILDTAQANAAVRRTVPTR